MPQRGPVLSVLVQLLDIGPVPIPELDAGEFLLITVVCPGFVYNLSHH